MTIESRAEYLPQCQTYDASKHLVCGWYASEKMDGIRCFWDGGITRGKPKSHIPWANISKDARYKNEQFATGLWTRYGHIIHAPNWWLDWLPKYPLDGELWIGYNERQTLVSTVKTIIPDSLAWEAVRYYIFGRPSLTAFIESRTIRKPLLNIKFDPDVFMGRLYYHGIDLPSADKQYLSWFFKDQVKQMAAQYGKTTGGRAAGSPVSGGPVRFLEQTLLSNQKPTADEQIAALEQKIRESGGEGIVFRHACSYWICCRSEEVLKYKFEEDAEGTIIDFISGAETDKGSKLLGKIGSLVVRHDYKGRDILIRLSGMNDSEREFETDNAVVWATKNPACWSPPWVNAASPELQRGKKVTFTFRGRSNDGTPQEGRYKRPYDEL